MARASERCTPETPAGDKLKQHRLLKASLGLAIFLAISRLLGVLLQVAAAALFGASAELDAYLVASSIPQLVAGLFLSGATIMLVPLIAKGDRPDADQTTRTAPNSALTLLLLLVLLAIVPALV